jgi:hypothetical protein
MRELDERDAEIQRLRDLLLVKEQELGEALGRLRELEDLASGLIALPNRVRARVPGAMRRGADGLRRLRGRRGDGG